MPPRLLFLSLIGLTWAGTAASRAQLLEAGFSSSTQSPRQETALFVEAEPGAPVKVMDRCVSNDIGFNAASPTWDLQAETAPCGVLETDNLLTSQTASGGIEQRSATSTIKYGLTPRLEIRWTPPSHIIQTGSGVPHSAGTTDEWFGICYRFHEAKQMTPGLAIDYSAKVPTANPAKGLGSGYTDNVLTFIASQDVGQNHFDVNIAGSIVGSHAGHDGVAQAGLAITRIVSSKLRFSLEAYGGAQPSSPDRYGELLAGGAWSLRPWLALNGAFSHAFASGFPHQQTIIGFIYSARPQRPLFIRGRRH